MAKNLPGLISAAHMKDVVPCMRSIPKMHKLITCIDRIDLGIIPITFSDFTEAKAVKFTCIFVNTFVLL